MIGCGAKPQPTVDVEGPGEEMGLPDGKTKQNEEPKPNERDVPPTSKARTASLQGPAMAAAPFDDSEAKQHQLRWADFIESPVEITNSIGMKFSLIPAGEFLMGSPESDSIAYDFEKPQHKVRITKPFYLGVYEVTQGEYEKVMGENPSWFSKGGSGPDHVSGKDTSGYPVEMVSWEDAAEFCKRLSAKERQTYRLPTEAEWEYACRAGTTTKWYCGDKEDELARVAWYGKDSAMGSTTHPVGAKEANAWGLFDIHGNVWEWCQDWWGPYSRDEAIDPTGPSDVAFPVYRGGCWDLRAESCRSAYRCRYEPDYRNSHRGFRVARSLSGK
jgi:formylglycine-generating enzyme required for sulfatase activity